MVRDAALSVTRYNLGMAKPEIFKDPLDAVTIRRLADETFGDMIKFVVDLEEEIICAGGGLHADEETILLERGSHQENLWGANYYPDLPPEDRWEYKSLINIRPRDGNTNQMIQSPTLREQVYQVAKSFFEPHV